MKTKRFIKLSKSFVRKYKDYQQGLNKFGYSMTDDGIFFTNENALNTFPQLFEGKTITYIEVGNDNFNPPIDPDEMKSLNKSLTDRVLFRKPLNPGNTLTNPPSLWKRFLRFLGIIKN